MFSPERILLATDLTEASDAAYQTACGLARSHSAHLTVLHIAPKGIMSYVEKVSELPTDETKEKLWEALRRPRDAEAGIEVAHQIEEGDPVSEIIRVARESNCDLIVLGTDGPHSGRTSWFTSSLTEDVLRKSPCSVLVVKEKDAEAKKEQAPASEVNDHVDATETQPAEDKGTKVEVDVPRAKAVAP